MTHVPSIAVAAGLALGLLLPASTASATAQLADRIEYRGEQHRLFSTPLESYWRKGEKPDALLGRHPTSCWRGYVASWAVRDGTLELTALESCRKDESLDLARILPDKTLPLRATWFTGVLRLPQGRMLGYVHMGFQSRFEKDLLLAFESGKLVREVLVDNVAAAQVDAKRRPEELDAGLAPIRSHLRECFGTSAPDAVELRLLVTADGQPSVVEPMSLPSKTAICVEANVIVRAKFGVAGSQTDQVHRFSLAEAGAGP